MALFDRDNRDRDFGRRWGGSPEYGGGARGWGEQDRAPGGGMRGIGRKIQNGIRDAFDRGGYDDRDYGGRHGGTTGRGFGGDRGWNAGTGGQVGGGMDAYDRDYDRSGFGYRGTEPVWGSRYGGGYDQDYGAGGVRDIGNRGWDRGRGVDDDLDRGIDRDRGAWGRGMGDDDRGFRGGKSHAQTDAGDPFGDRQSRTPIRVMRGDIGRGEMGRGDLDRGDVHRGGMMGGGVNRGGMLRGGWDRDETDRGDWGRGDLLNRMGRGGDRYDQGMRGGQRGWNQGIGDDPYYNAQDFRGNYDRELRGRERDRGGDWF